MVNTLNLGENLSEQVWSAMKYIFVSEPQLLVEKHMDQLILCNIYAVSKVFQIPIKFQDIISKYSERFLSLLLENIVFELYLIFMNILNNF